MQKVMMDKAAPILLILVTMIACLAATSCGGGEGITTRAESTIISTGSTEDDTKAYASDIRDLAANADTVNTDYRKLLVKYDAGTVSKEEVTEFASGAEGEFKMMSSRLRETNPPESFSSEHQQMISAFDKWGQFYQLQIEGLDSSDVAMLEQARDLDSQAATEVNDAIRAINDKLTGN